MAQRTGTTTHHGKAGRGHIKRETLNNPVQLPGPNFAHMAAPMGKQPPHTLADLEIEGPAEPGGDNPREERAETKPKGGRKRII